MVEEHSSFASRSAIVLTEKASRLHFVFAFLSLAFGLALIRGHSGAATDAGRVAVDLFMGGLLLIVLVTWWYLYRHPVRLGIGSDAITLWYRGGKSAQQFLRDSGDLYIRYAGGRYPQPYLRITGSDEAIRMAWFDIKQVTDACVASGWRFVNPNG
jgi:hypothetical protein